jgi:tetratricopeptide (TPR) repeat protein
LTPFERLRFAGPVGSVGLEIRVLGPVEVCAGHVTMGHGRPQQGVALAVLAEHAGRPVPVETLVRCVWGGAPPPGAVRLLNTHITRIRRMLEQACTAAGDAVIEVPRRAGGYVLQVDPDRVDLHRFRRLVARAEARDRLPGDRIALLCQALALWRGEALTGLPGSWAEQARHAWNQQRLAAVLAWAAAELQAGNPSVVIDALVPEVAQHRLVEPLVATLMRALAEAGRSAEALEYYAKLRGRLVEELGADPGAQARAVHQAILRGEFDTPEVRPRPDAAPRRVVPAQLPADVPAFIGRTVELARLDAVSGVTGTAVVSAVCGTAGVGKTALAMHWAHRVRDRFPDGQLYVNLRGYDPDRPMAAASALAVLLDALGVAAQDVPLDPDARAARYRTELAGRRMLVVLDNAATVEQVRPLLPGTASCTTVVTSRDRLAGLVALHGAQRIELDLLPVAEARVLLERLIGRRAHAEPEAATALAERCARLPLALRVAAELAVGRPRMPLGELANELADLQRRLDLLDADGDPRAAVASVFSWSVRNLPPEVARAFRLLGLHPGPDFDGYAAAAVTGTGLAGAEAALDALARAYLVQPTASGRFGMHDLLRAYANQLAATHESDDDRWAAQQRLFDLYVAAAGAAMDVLYSDERRQRPRVERPTTPMPVLGDKGSARRWLDAERPNLVTVAARSATSGRPAPAVRLSPILHRYLDSGHYTDALDLHTHAHRAARLAGDAAGQGWALFGLGTTHLRLDRYGPAAKHLRLALVRFRRAGDRTGQARTLNNLGNVESLRGHYDAAATHHQHALALSRQLSDRSGQARALDGLGNVEQRRANNDVAAGYLRQALALYRRAGNRFGEAHASTNLGLAEQRLGRHHAATEHLEHGLALFQQFGHRSGEAAALDNLGILHSGLGQPERAAGYFARALALYREMGDQEGQTWALNGLGEAALSAGRPGDADARHTAALAIATDIDARAQQARAHTGLGHVHRTLGDPGRAGHHYRLALAIYMDLRSLEADTVRDHLAALASTPRQPGVNRDG